MFDHDGSRASLVFDESALERALRFLYSFLSPEFSLSWCLSFTVAVRSFFNKLLTCRIGVAR